MLLTQLFTAANFRLISHYHQLQETKLIYGGVVGTYLSACLKTHPGPIDAGEFNFWQVPHGVVGKGRAHIPMRKKPIESECRLIAHARILSHTLLTFAITESYEQRVEKLEISQNKKRKLADLAATE